MGVCVVSAVLGFSPDIRRPRCQRTRQNQGQCRRRSRGCRSKARSTCCLRIRCPRMRAISIPSSRFIRSRNCSTWWRRRWSNDSEGAGKWRENKRKSNGAGQELGKVSVLTSSYTKARTEGQAFINDIAYDIIGRKYGNDRRIA